MDAGAAERALGAWREHDTTLSIHSADREAVGATEAARALVLELFAKAGPAAASAGREGRPHDASAAAPRDLYNACARLGRLLAEAGASPSLAAATIDGAVRALAEAGIAVDPARVPAARASVAEGYVAVAQEIERAGARRAWEYPACAVRVAKDAVAIATGYPSDDGDAVGDWAARVALAASRDGVKRAVIAGSDLAAAELSRALGLLGITVVESLETGKRSGEAPAATGATGATGKSGESGKTGRGWLSFLRQK